MALSPMMTKYLETKDEYPDTILFYRLGDFYEMFFEDAIVAAKELELTLTGKDCGLEERAPMCGVPHHSAENYINRLVLKGYKVAIAEQVEDPKLVKGLVKREVVRVVTPGTLTNTGVLAEDKNNFIFSIVYLAGKFGIAISDISTGDFFITEVSNVRQVYDEINKYSPKEIVHNSNLLISGIEIIELKEKYGIIFSELSEDRVDENYIDSILNKHFSNDILKSIDNKEYGIALISAAYLLLYFYSTQKSSLSQIIDIKAYTNADYMILDVNSRRNLELVETLREKKKQGSLLGVLDKTKTAMGARLLRSYIERPLIYKEDILKRYDVIEEFINRYIDREELKEYLSSIYDIERLMSKISLGSASTKDLLAFANSIKLLPDIKRLLSSFDSQLLKDLYLNLDELQDLYNIINSSIKEDASLSLKEGNIIKSGYNEEVDKYRLAKEEGKTWLSELENEQRELTGIKNLRISYNKVFGYFFEVTNSYKDLVPDYFVRKQTLTGSERYTINRLKELEELILNAEDKLGLLEYNLFLEIRENIAKEMVRIKNTARVIASIDVLVSLSVVASNNNYVRPKLNEKGIIDIKEGRHAVVEAFLKDRSFITNDTYLDSNKNRFSILTGPNMAGKSTYMRQVALIVLLAQIGSFVPATSANICICDRLFTRVGASDDLAAGQSTFMVEMIELSNILKNATKNSLIILDEIGRGTSTFDGLSIAWSVVEYISDLKILGAKTLFATHYHELTELEGSIAGVNNYFISVKEQGEDIVFLRKILRGFADKSYGVAVARLAGIPEPVLKRSKEILQELEQADIASNASILNKKNYKSIQKQNELEAKQFSLFDTVKNDDIIEEIKNIDINSLRGMDALNILDNLQNKIKNRI